MRVIIHTAGGRIARAGVRAGMAEMHVAPQTEELALRMVYW
jgi:hypothetical protein